MCIFFLSIAGRFYNRHKERWANITLAYLSFSISPGTFTYVCISRGQTCAGFRTRYFNRTLETKGGEYLRPTLVGNSDISKKKKEKKVVYGNEMSTQINGQSAAIFCNSKRGNKVCSSAFVISVCLVPFMRIFSLCRFSHPSQNWPAVRKGFVLRLLVRHMRGTENWTREFSIIC